MKNAFYNVLISQRASLLCAWQTRIRRTSVLQLREDFDGHAPDDVLEEFFDLVVAQIATKQDYHLLRQRNVEIARLLTAQTRRAAHLTTNNRIAQMALSTLDPAEIFRRIVHEVQQSFNYQHVSLYFVETHANQMIMKARAGVYEKHFPEGYRQKVGEGIVGHVVASGNPIMTNDVTNDPRRIIAFPQEKNTRSELCVPIKTGDRVLGSQHGSRF